MRSSYVCEGVSAMIAQEERAETEVVAAERERARKSCEARMVGND